VGLEVEVLLQSYYLLDNQVRRLESVKACHIVLNIKFLLDLFLAALFRTLVDVSFLDVEVLEGLRAAGITCALSQQSVECLQNVLWEAGRFVLFQLAPESLDPFLRVFRKALRISSSR